jgi:hypothetical protein
MSISIPPLLFGFAYSRLGRNGSRDVDLNTSAGPPPLQTRECAEAAGIERSRLEGYDLVALMLDGKTFAEDEMVSAVCVTIMAEKVVLGFVQTPRRTRRSAPRFCARSSSAGSAWSSAS